MPFTYPLPSDTREKWRHCRFKCSNLSLLLDRYLGYPTQWEFSDKDKADLFKKLKSYFNSILLKNMIPANYSRWQASIQTFPYTQSFTAYPEWRMVVGLGQNSIMETGMTLNRTNGIPYIPGSALKGLSAAYALLQELGETTKEHLEAITPSGDLERKFLQIFGTQENTGQVIFLDAVPSKIPELEPDIMNSHYPDYYGGNQPPRPSQSPIPVYFLTLGKKSQFAFAVAGRDSRPETEEMVNLAKTWLQKALTEMGIGAKTAAGYGYFTLE